MATNLGTLTLNLLANTGSYTQGLSKAERQTQQSTKEMASGFDLVGKSVTSLQGIVAGISVATVSAFALDVVNAGNEIKKFADLTKSSVTQFQYYAKGAETAGYSLEQFAMVNKDVFDRLGEAGRGEGEMMDFFDKIAPKVGITIDQFKGLSGPEALQKYYNGLERANLSQPEMVTYMEQIANDASLLIPLLKNGGAGFKYWGDAAEKAGAVMSDDMVASLVESKKQLQLLDLQWQGLKVTLASGAMPVLSTVIENFDVISTAGGILSAVIGGRIVSSYVASNVAIITNTAATKSKAIADYEAAKAGLVSTAAMVKSMGAVNAETAALVANARAKYQNAAAAREAAVASGTMATMGRGALALAGGWLGLGVTVATVAAGYLLMGDNVEKSTESLIENNENVDEAIVKYRELNAVQRSAQLVDQRDKLEKLTSTYEDAVDKLERYTDNQQSAATYTSKSAIEIGNLFAEYKKTGDLEKFNSLIQASSNISQGAKDKIAVYARSVYETGEAANSQKAFVAQLTAGFNTNADAANNAAAGNKNAVSGINAVGDAADRSKNKLAGLTAEQIKYVQQVEGAVLRDQYIKNQMTRGYSRDRATHMAGERAKSGMGFAVKDGAMPAAVSQAEADAWALQQAGKNREAALKKAQEFEQKQSDARKKSADDAANLREKQNEVLKQQASDRQQISEQFVDDFARLNIDYQKEIDGINKANFGAETGKYAALAKARYDFNTEMYLRQQTEENDAFRWSEEYKLQFEYETQKEIAENSGRYNDELQKVKLASLKDKFDQESAWMKLEQAQRISDAGSMLRTDLQNMELKYGFEREQILKNAQLSDDERQRRIALSNASEDFEKNKNLKSANAAWGGTFADMSGTGEQYRLEQERFSRGDQSQDLFDSQMALADTAAEREAIWQAHNDRMILIDQDYQSKSLQMSMSYGADILGSLLSQAGTVWGSMTQLVKDSAGESSTAYKAMFLAQQAIAIGQAIINTELGATKALAEGGMIMGVPAATMVRTMGYASVGLIAAQTISGMAHDGIDNIPKEGTWLLDKGERVVDSRTNSDLKNYLANGGGGGDVKISQTIVVNTDGSAKVDTEGQKQLAKGFQSMMEAYTRKEMRQGGSIYNFVRGR